MISQLYPGHHDEAHEHVLDSLLKGRYHTERRHAVDASPLARWIGERAKAMWLIAPVVDDVLLVVAGRADVGMLAGMDTVNQLTIDHRLCYWLGCAVVASVGIAVWIVMRHR